MCRLHLCESMPGVLLLQLLLWLFFMHPRCVAETLLVVLRPGPETGKQ